jgi:hypothetical protein
MDVPTHEGIHLVTARDDGTDVFLRQCWQDKAVRHVDAELISAAPSARMALEARVDALRRIPANRVSSDPSDRHADDSYSFLDVYKSKLDLRLECFNSVDGSSRLIILLGWYRFVCSNGLGIGESKIEIKERHKQGVELASIRRRLRQALASVEADRATMKKWQVEKVVIDDIATWADKRVSELSTGK